MSKTVTSSWHKHWLTQHGDDEISIEVIHITIPTSFLLLTQRHVPSRNDVSRTYASPPLTVVDIHLPFNSQISLKLCCDEPE